ncbi:MAG: autotransporter outer membrane beta-barrel domain-containing protein [Hyphomicrobium sp.]|nr:autotransporter outer membrane beta-barrel domain-containing protein [Hyphomicrobium sp.]
MTAAAVIWFVSPASAMTRCPDKSVTFGLPTLNVNADVASGRCFAGPLTPPDAIVFGLNRDAVDGVAFHARDNSIGQPIRLSCPGGHIKTVSFSPVKTVFLSPGESCDFTLSAKINGTAVQLTGRLRRTLRGHEATNVVASGGRFGQSAVELSTIRTIRNFMLRRSDQIMANDPDLSKRVADRGGNEVASFTGQGDLGNSQLEFATSLRQIVLSDGSLKAARNADLSAKLGIGPSNMQDLSKATAFDIWVQGKWAGIQDGTDEQSLGLLYVGVDYRFTSSFVMGVLVQSDWASEKSAVGLSSITGRGWLAGPYTVARIHDNVIFDGRIAYGHSDNEISPTMSYVDRFQTSRWLIEGNFTGDFELADWHVEPQVGLSYFDENQIGYLDSLGNWIAGQSVNYARLTVGPRFSRRFEINETGSVVPYLGVKAIWDLAKAKTIDYASDPVSSNDNELRGRVEGGVSVDVGGGLTVDGEGFYDGFGVNDFEAFGGSVNFNLSLN